MVLRSSTKPLFRHRCDISLFYPYEEDGPGTLTILEYRCVLPRAHVGPHQVETVD